MGRERERGEELGYMCETLEVAFLVHWLTIRYSSIFDQIKKSSDPEN